MGQRRRIRMTMLRAAEIVLGRSEEPLHANEIIQRAISAGLIKPKGKSPDHSLQSVYRLYHGKETSIFGLNRGQTGKRFEDNTYIRYSPKLQKKGAHTGTGEYTETGR